MNLDELQKNWQKFGEEDPLWAILTIPEMKNNKWDPEEFFQRGILEISEVISKIEAIGAKLHYGKALDFGCGVGRLTQALAARFSEAHGVDIAPSMIEAARQFNKFGEKCSYHINKKNDLSLFPDNYFDFIYSVIVLQHMHPRYSLKYIQEFLRVLQPGGVLVFQLPSEPKLQPIQQQTDQVEPTRSLLKFIRPFHTTYRHLRNRLKPPQPLKPRMEMHGVPKEELLTFLEQNEAMVLDVQEDNWAGPPWNSYTYFVTVA